jgi:hypothetical protein
MPMAGMKTKAAAALHWEFMFARADMIKQRELLSYGR